MSLGPARRVIVVAAESPTVQRVLGSVLGRVGYAVTSVGDGVGAVQAAFAGPVDAVVATGSLPRLSGYAVTRVLREDPRTAHLPVLLLTPPGVAADRYWALRCGANTALSANVEAHDLTAAVAEQLAVTVGLGPSGPPRGLRDPDEAVFVRAAEVLERALFESALVAEITDFAVAGRGAQGGVAGLLSTVARVADCAIAAVVTPVPAQALASICQPISRSHYRDMLLRAAADLSGATGTTLDATALDARAADAGALLGADEQAHLAVYRSFPLTGPDGLYVGHLVVTSSAAEGLSQRVLRTLTLIAEPAGRLVATTQRPRRA